MAKDLGDSKPPRIAAQDVQTVSASLFACLDSAFASTPETPWSKSSIQTLIESPHGDALAIYAARTNRTKHEDDIAGADTPAAALLFQAVGDTAELLTLGTHAEHCGLGLGHDLIRHLLIHLSGRDVPRLILEVRESNATARRLYAKFGAVEIGRRKNYYALKPEAGLSKTKPSHPGRSHTPHRADALVMEIKTSPILDQP